MNADELSVMHWQNALLSSVEVGIVVIDRDYNVEVWNQFMENHSNKVPRSVIGKSLFSTFSEIDEHWLRIKAEPVFNLKSPAFIIWEQRPFLFHFACSRPITSDATFMYQNVTMFPLTSLSGDVTRLCMLVYDVTEQALGKLNIERLNKELKYASRTDGMTGLFNRRYWQERFENSYKLAKRRDRAITSMMLDIDHFKKINDTYGHQAGDEVIRSLAGLIKGSIRETDLAGRYGGEEFAVVLHDTDTEGALIVAERIRKRSQDHQVTHDDIVITFTVSIGLSEFSQDFTSPLTWLETADKALYKSKAAGRNCISVYSSDTE